MEMRPQDLHPLPSITSTTVQANNYLLHLSLIPYIFPFIGINTLNFFTLMSPLLLFMTSPIALNISHVLN
ncbi:unnamed protein product [Caenorhabditis nigoni]